MARPRPAASEFQGGDGAAQTEANAAPWDSSKLVQPDDLAKELAGPAGSHPHVVCVGFQFLYKTAHVRDSEFYGPAREAAGLDSLKKAAAHWPRNRNLVIYCGCCPFRHCPNVRPAFDALNQMGFTHVRVLMVAHNLGEDWVHKGLPVDGSVAANAPATK